MNNKSEKKPNQDDPFWDAGPKLTPEEQKLASDPLIAIPITATVLVVGFAVYFTGSQLGWW